MTRKHPQAQANEKPPRFTILVLLAGVLVIDLIGFGWGLPNTIPPHPDDVAKPTLWAMQSFFLEPTKYPKVHYLTLGAAYTPYLGWLWITGGLNLSGADPTAAGSEVLANPLSAFTALFLIARGVTVAMHLGAVWILYATLLRLTRRRNAALLCAALFGVAPEVALFARMSNVDIPMVFWFAAATHIYFRFLENPTRRNLIFLALLAVLSVCTKEQIGFILFPMVVHAGIHALFQTQGGVRQGMAALVPAGLLGLLLYALLNGIFWAPEQWLERMTWWHTELSSFEDYWTQTGERAGALALCRDVAVRFPFVAGAGGALLCLWAVLFSILRPTRKGFLLLALFAGYLVLTFSFLGFVQSRYLLPAVYLAMLLFGYHLGRGKAALALTVLALLLNTAHVLLVDRALLREPRTKVYSWLKEHVQPTTPVEIYANDNYLPPLTAMGLKPVRIKTFSKEAFRQRNPMVVIVTDGFDWSRKGPENEYIHWLASGPKGYRAWAFGPEKDGAATFFLAPEMRQRICPNMTVLVREGGAGR